MSENNLTACLYACEALLFPRLNVLTRMLLFGHSRSEFIGVMERL